MHTDTAAYIAALEAERAALIAAARAEEDELDADHIWDEVRMLDLHIQELESE